MYSQGAGYKGCLGQRALELAYGLEAPMVDDAPLSVEITKMAPTPPQLMADGGCWATAPLLVSTTYVFMYVPTYLPTYVATRLGRH